MAAIIAFVPDFRGGYEKRMITMKLEKGQLMEQIWVPDW